MADPARPGENDEALEILRRLEPAITDVQTRLGRLEKHMDHVEKRLESVEIRLGNVESRVQHLETRVEHVETTQRQHGEAIAELRGKVSQLPTLIQIVTAMVMVNAIIVAGSFGLARLLLTFA